MPHTSFAVRAAFVLLAGLTISAPAAAAEEWLTVTTGDTTTLTVLPDEDVRGPIGNLVMACNPDGRLTLSYDVEKSSVVSDVDSADARLVVEAEPAGRKIIVQSIAPRQDAGRRWSYPMDMKQAAALIDQIKASATVTIGIAPTALSAADLLDGDFENRGRFGKNPYALGALSALCPKAAELALTAPELPAPPAEAPAEPEAPPAPPASAWFGGDDDPPITVSRTRDADLYIGCVTSIGINLYLPASPELESASRRGDLRLNLTTGGAGNGGFYLEFAKLEPSDGGQMRAFAGGGLNEDYVLRNAVEALLMDNLPVYAGIVEYVDGEYEDIAGATFGAEGKAEAFQAVLDACEVKAPPASPDTAQWNSREWTIARTSDAPLEAGILKDDASLVLTSFDCKSIGFAYSFPASDLHRDLAGRSQVDLVISRDGRGDYRYFTDLSFDISGDVARVALVIAADLKTLDEISRASRTIDISLSRDAKGGTLRNKTQFSAKGSTAAIKALRTSCDETQTEQPPPAANGSAWSVKPSSDGNAFYLESRAQNGAELALICFPSGGYELSFTLPTAVAAPEIAVRSEAAIALAATGGRTASTAPSGIGSFKDTLFFGGRVASGDDVYDLLSNASGVITAGVKAGESPVEPEFNTTAFVTTGLDDAWKEYRRRCSR